MRDFDTYIKTDGSNNRLTSDAMEEALMSVEEVELRNKEEWDKIDRNKDALYLYIVDGGEISNEEIYYDLSYGSNIQFPLIEEREDGDYVYSNPDSWTDAVLAEACKQVNIERNYDPDHFEVGHPVGCVRSCIRNGWRSSLISLSDYLDKFGCNLSYMEIRDLLDRVDSDGEVLSEVMHSLGYIESDKGWDIAGREE